MAGVARPHGADDRLGQRGFREDRPGSRTETRSGGVAGSGMQQLGGSSAVGMGPQRRLIGRRLVSAVDLCRGVAKLVKALDFDSSMRRFESFLPCQIR